MSFFLTCACITCVKLPKIASAMLGMYSSIDFFFFQRHHLLSSPTVPRLSEPKTQSGNASSQPLNELQWWMPFQWSSPHMPSWIERARCHLSHTSRPEANRDSHGLVIATPTDHLKLSWSFVVVKRLDGLHDKCILQYRYDIKYWAPSFPVCKTAE